MRRTITPEIWEQAKIAFASGSIGFRELARKINIPQGTMTARASREGWTQEINAARQVTADAKQPLAASPTVLQSVNASLQERGQRYAERMAGVTENVMPYLEKMQPETALKRIHDIEKYDKMARRNFGLGDSAVGGSLSLNILTNQAAIGVSLD